MQRVNLYEPLSADRQCLPPLVLNVSVAKPAAMISGGVPMQQVTNEHYILLSCLPDELKQRVITAIQALQAGG